MNDDDALARLADIELPAAPEWGLLPLLPVIAVTIGVMIWMIVRYRARRRSRAAATPGPVPAPNAPESSRPLQQQALTRLDELQQAWRAGTLDDREAGYRLGTLLRRGLALNRLDETPPVAGDDDIEEWRSLVDDLAALRYRPRHPPLTAALFAQARDLLARGDGGGDAHHA